MRSIAFPYAQRQRWPLAIWLGMSLLAPYPHLSGRPTSPPLASPAQPMPSAGLLKELHAALQAGRKEEARRLWEGLTPHTQAQHGEALLRSACSFSYLAPPSPQARRAKASLVEMLLEHPGVRPRHSTLLASQALQLSPEGRALLTARYQVHKEALDQAAYAGQLVPFAAALAAGAHPDFNTLGAAWEGGSPLLLERLEQEGLGLKSFQAAIQAWEVTPDFFYTRLFQHAARAGQSRLLIGLYRRIPLLQSYLASSSHAFGLLLHALKSGDLATVQAFFKLLPHPFPASSLPHPLYEELFAEALRQNALPLLQALIDHLPAREEGEGETPPTPHTGAPRGLSLLAQQRLLALAMGCTEQGILELLKTWLQPTDQHYPGLLAATQGRVTLEAYTWLLREHPEEAHVSQALFNRMAAYGSLPLLQRAYQEEPELCIEQESLLAAIRSGAVELLRYLLEAQDRKLPDPYLMEEALASGRADLVGALQAAWGDRPGLPLKVTALYKALQGGNLALVEGLLASQPDILEQRARPSYAVAEDLLCQAIATDQLAIVKRILSLLESHLTELTLSPKVLKALLFFRSIPVIDAIGHLRPAWQGRVRWVGGTAGQLPQRPGYRAISFVPLQQLVNAYRIPVHCYPPVEEIRALLRPIHDHLLPEEEMFIAASRLPDGAVLTELLFALNPHFCPSKALLNHLGEQSTPELPQTYLRHLAYASKYRLAQSWLDEQVSPQLPEVLVDEIMDFYGCPPTPSTPQLSTGPTKGIPGFFLLIKARDQLSQEA